MASSIASQLDGMECSITDRLSREKGARSLAHASCSAADHCELSAA
jgi:hypothetical protein